MSDFLDRLATRAIGDGAGLLRPRLPSLFEPPAGVPAEPLAVDFQEHVARPLDAVPADVPPPPHRREPAPVAPAVAEKKTASSSWTTAAVPTLARPPVSDERPAAPRSMAVREPAPSGKAATKDPAPPATRASLMDTPRPRPAAILKRPPMIPSASARGALLPPASPVFATLRSESPARDRDVGAGTIQSRMAATTHGSHGEPVVHVSIGRLEVRAPPIATPASHHRDAPRPASLDDYLRQRGKASP